MKYAHAVVRVVRNLSGAWNVWLVVFTMAAVALAGCTGGDGDASGVPNDVSGPADVTDDTGGIQGLVLSDEGLPVAGAQVALGTDGDATTTDEQGRFTFSGVAPGSYQLFVQKLGFQTIGRSISVQAGDVTEVEVTVSAIQVAEPYHLTLNQEGLFGCGLSWRPAVVYSGVAICGVVGGDVDDFLLEFHLEGPMDGWEEASGVFETEWQSNQAAGRGLSVNWEKLGCSNVGDSRFVRTQGHNPHHGYVEGDHIESVRDDGCSSSNCDGDDECNIQSRVFSFPDTLGESAPADVGITIQQRYTNFMTAFFYEPGDVGFTALADA